MNENISPGELLFIAVALGTFIFFDIKASDFGFYIIIGVGIMAAVRFYIAFVRWLIDAEPS